jgi:hypothetical protein
MDQYINFMMDKQDELRMINYNSDARLGAKYSVLVYRTVCCSYDRVCVPLCDGKVTIFECGEEKLLPGCPKWQSNTCDVAEQR